MPGSFSGNNNIVAVHEAGTSDAQELNQAIARAWKAVLSSPAERADISLLLGVVEDELDPDRPPFQASVSGAGTFGADILIALAVGFATGFAKEFGGGLGSVAGKKSFQALRDLWNFHIRERVSPFGNEKLGREKDDSGD